MKKLKYPFGALVISIFIAQGLQRSREVHASTPPPTPTVTTLKAQLTELSDQLSYPARIESKVNAMIYAESEGVVMKIVAPLGSEVHKRGRVAIVKHTDPVYSYAPFILMSPVDGIVSQVTVTEGSAVTKGQLIAAVTDPKKIRAIIEVAAADMPSLKRGMDGQLLFGAKQETVTKVRIVGMSPLVDLATGTATCEMEINGSDLKSLPMPGSVGQVTFKVNRRQSFVLPDFAIVYRGDDTFVRLVENGIAKKVMVSLGRKERGQVEILKGLKNGDVVVQRASGFIGDGEKVQVQDSKVE